MLIEFSLTAILTKPNMQNGMERTNMSKEIKDLIERASKINMSRDDREAQRRSFAYGNAHIENDRVTREMIDEAARELTKE